MQEYCTHNLHMYITVRMITKIRKRDRRFFSKFTFLYLSILKQLQYILSICHSSISFPLLFYSQFRHLHINFSLSFLFLFPVSPLFTSIFIFPCYSSSLFLPSSHLLSFLIHLRFFPISLLFTSFSSSSPSLSSPSLPYDCFSSNFLSL